ncbi:hypothetical protein Bca4012_027355 [Brassica carinata]
MESTELYAPEELIKRSPEPSEDDSAENPVSSIQCGRERRLHGSTITDFLAKSEGSDVEPRRRLKLMVPNSSCGKHNWKKRATVKQEADFIWKAQIVEGLQQNGWSFVSCTGCSRKLDKSGTSLRCNRCVNPKVTGVIKEMLKLTKHDAAALALDECPPMKLHLLKMKVAKQPLLPATRLGLKAMNQIQPVLKVKKEDANAP